MPGIPVPFPYPFKNGLGPVADSQLERDFLSLQEQIPKMPFIVVATDGTGDYTTLQAAVDAIPDTSQRTFIWIKSIDDGNSATITLPVDTSGTGEIVITGNAFSIYQFISPGSNSFTLTIWNTKITTPLGSGAPLFTNLGNDSRVRIYDSQILCCCLSDTSNNYSVGHLTVFNSIITANRDSGSGNVGMFVNSDNATPAFVVATIHSTELHSGVMFGSNGINANCASVSLSVHGCVLVGGLGSPTLGGTSAQINFVGNEIDGIGDTVINQRASGDSVVFDGNYFGRNSGGSLTVNASGSFYGSVVFSNNQANTMKASSISSDQTFGGWDLTFDAYEQIVTDNYFPGSAVTLSNSTTINEGFLSGTYRKVACALRRSRIDVRLINPSPGDTSDLLTVTGNDNEVSMACDGAGGSGGPAAHGINVSGNNNVFWATGLGTCTAPSTDSGTGNTINSILAAGLPSLADGDIWIGNGSNIATARALSGDVTITDTGVATVTGLAEMETDISDLETAQTEMETDITDLEAASTATNALVTEIETDLGEKADLASPAFTGHPTGVTESPGDNSTRLSTTAYTDAAAAVINALVTEQETDLGELLTAIALLAPLASPALTGTPTAPTAAGGTNTTQLATTAFVEAAVGSGLPSLADTKIWIGSALAVATAFALSGDVTMTDGGVVAIGANKVTLAMMATIADQRMLGNVSGGAAVPVAMTAAQVKTMLAIALADIATQADATILGNNSGGAHVPIALSAAQTKTLLAIANTDVSGLGTASTHASTDYQTADSDLTTISGLTATTDSFMQSKSSAWAARTIAQVKTDLSVAGPRFARVHLSSSVACTTGVSKTITFDTADSDTLSMWDSATKLIIPASMNNTPITVSAGVRFTANVTGIRIIDLLKNGVVVRRNLEQAVSVAGTISVISIAMGDLAATSDFWQLSVQQTSGGNLNAEAATYSLYLEISGTSQW